MLRSLVFQPATRYSVQQLAAYFTAVYEGYPFPVVLSAEMLARRIREEALDLGISEVMDVQGSPIGLFLLARRGDAAWCGGFGIIKPKRGKGLSAQLCAEMIACARRAGIGHLSLEVLAKNAAAIAAYKKAGFRPVRELLILSSKREQIQPELTPTETVDPKHVLLNLVSETGPKPCWQRDVGSLFSRANLSARQTCDGQAQVLFTVLPQGVARLLGMRADSKEKLKDLLLSLRELYSPLMLVNEPYDSPWLEVLTQAGFKETDRQFEMAIEINET
jgi:GNAT superfamily N-acetyltransferase